MGRIINRLTKDTSDVDKNLADFASFFLRSSLQLVTTVVLIGYYVPFALAALIPILLCFYLLYAYFQVSWSPHVFSRLLSAMQARLRRLAPDTLALVNLVPSACTTN